MKVHDVESRLTGAMIPRPVRGQSKRTRLRGHKAWQKSNSIRYGCRSPSFAVQNRSKDPFGPMHDTIKRTPFVQAVEIQMAGPFPSVSGAIP